MSDPQAPTPPIPKFDLHSVIVFLWENWAVVKRHWLLFLVLVGAAAVIAGTAIRLLDTRQIDILSADNSRLRDRNLTLTQTAAITPPSQWRRLSDQERSDLIAGLKQWSSKPKSIAVYAMAESESRQYAAQFVDVIRSAGIEPHPKEVPLSSGADVGLMVGVMLPPNTIFIAGNGLPASPSATAQQFSDILEQAGLKPHFTPWVKIDNEAGEFDLFVGPKPW